MTGSAAVSLEQINRRLEQIDDKLDRVIRLEERQQAIHTAHGRLEKRVDDLAEKVHVLELSAAGESVKTGSHGSVLWLVGSVIVTGVITAVLAVVLK